MNIPKLVDPMIGQLSPGVQQHPVTSSASSISYPDPDSDDLEDNFDDPASHPQDHRQPCSWHTTKAPVATVNPARVNLKPHSSPAVKSPSVSSVVQQIPKLKITNPGEVHTQSRNYPPISKVSIPPDWRETNTTLAQANKFMLSSVNMLNKYSDCMFLVGNQKEVVQAHRVLLAARSNVLEALLDAQPTIEVPEVSHRSLKAFLHFLYTDEFKIDNEIITEVFHLASRFNVRLLKQKCAAQIGSRISLENCVDVYQTFGRSYDPDGLGRKAFEFIVNNFGTVMKSGEFLRFDVLSLQAVLASNDICVEEFEIFEAIIRWAERQCDINGWTKSSSNKRKVMESLIRLIRFPLMNSSTFASRVVPCGILAQDEIVLIFMYLNGTPHQRLSMRTDPFDKTPRRRERQTPFYVPHNIRRTAY